MTILFKENFDAGNLGKFKVSGIPPVAILAPSRTGSHCMRSHLKAEEKRSEVKVYKGYATIGNEYWYGFSIFLSEGFANNDNWEHVAQWHGTPDFDIGENWRSPVMSLMTANAYQTETRGEWTVNVRWDSKRNTFESGEVVYEGTKTFEFGPYKTGVWTDWVYRVKWSYESDGLLEIWKNHKKVLEYDGPNCYNDAVGPYFKMGIYRGGRGAIDTRIVYHDEFRWADGNSTYEDVAPGGKAPEPEPKSPISGTSVINVNIPATQIPITVDWKITTK